MSNLTKFLLSGLLLVGVFAAGYWTKPDRVVHDTVTKIVKRPDGTTETVIVEKEMPVPGLG
jgi:hypothetical protein